MLNLAEYFPIANPTMIFFVVLCIILFAPIVMGKLRIPHIVGMILAGIVVGKYGLNILERDSSFELFGKVGLFYIMFLSGIEMDIKGLRHNGGTITWFGLLNFFAPFLLMYLAGTYILHFPLLPTMLLSCIMASNTLIAYPIVCKYGLQRHRSVTLCVGASMISLTLALMVLAGVVGSYSDGAGMGFWLLFLLKIAVFVLVGVYFIPRATRYFLARYSDSVTQYIFVLSILFLCASVSEMIGLEGVFGAFFAGICLNRYIPHVSPLMNRIEFTGNALFIPYFLIGVGMLIDIRVLFQGAHALVTILVVTLFGTLGKAIASYAVALKARLSLTSGNVMFGLTSAHAAGSIAIIMVGMRLRDASGAQLVSSEVLNAVVMMILFTCVIGSLITEMSARKIALQEKQNPTGNEVGKDEKILIPLKYQGNAQELVSLGILMRNPRLNRGLVGLNMIRDDAEIPSKKALGRQVLEMAAKAASAADVRMMTQTRITTNIANGIMHAFKEYDASEIIMGLHQKRTADDGFWGIFTPNLVTELSRQVILLRSARPLNTLRRIVVATPSRVEFEIGFYRWVERLAQLAENLGCRIEFHARESTIQLIERYVSAYHPMAKPLYIVMQHWKDFTRLQDRIRQDHLLVVITARKGTLSYKPAFEKLPEELERHFQGCSLMIVYPDQNGESPESMTFTAPQKHDLESAWTTLLEWVDRIRRH